MNPPQPLTGPGLCAYEAVIRQIYEHFIPSQHGRAERAPIFRGCLVSNQWVGGRFIAIVRIFVTETQNIPRYAPFQRELSFYFGICQDGTIQNNNQDPHFREAYDFYVQPLLQFLRDSDFAPFVAAREMEAKVRIQERTRAIHEELAATVWAPERLAKRLEQGGWELVEAL